MPHSAPPPEKSAARSKSVGRSKLAACLAAGALFIDGAPLLAQSVLAQSAHALPVVAQSAHAPIELPGWEPPRRDYVALDRDRVSTDSPRDDKTRKWLLAMEAVTNVPVDLGVRLTAETPFRLRLATSFGMIPGAYLGLINNAISGMGAYDERTAGIVRGSFTGGHVWRTQLGVRPFPQTGLYIEAGYARVQLSGSVHGADLLPLGSDGVIDGLRAQGAGYRVRTAIHMWVIELGFHTKAFERMTLGIGVGMMGTLAANTEAVPNFEQGQSPLAVSLSRSATDSINGGLESYGYVPTLTLRVGYDFL